MSTKPIYRRAVVFAKFAPGVKFHMQNAADAMGLHLSEWLRLAIDVVPGERGAPHLVVRLPTADHIGVVGTQGGMVGTLGAILNAEASLDDVPFTTPQSRIAQRCEILVEAADLERDIDGKLTGRIARVRQRRPGRRRAVQAERVRTLLAQRPDLTEGNRAPGVR